MGCCTEPEGHDQRYALGDFRSVFGLSDESAAGEGGSHPNIILIMKMSRPFLKSPDISIRVNLIR